MSSIPIQKLPSLNHIPQQGPLRRPVLATKYIKNSLSYDSSEMEQICASARKSNFSVVLGFSERCASSVYIAQCIINAHGQIIMKRRILKGTHVERTLFGNSGASSLNNVVDVERVRKVGALNCWAAKISQEPAGITAHAVEGYHMLDKVGGGRSAVYAPDGRRLTKPLPPDEEGFVYAELPMDMLIIMKHFADPVGHHSRPDLLWLGVDTREKDCVRREGEHDKEMHGSQKEVNGHSRVDAPDHAREW